MRLKFNFFRLIVAGMTVLLTICYSFQLRAQDLSSFTVNRQHVNVDSLDRRVGSLMDQLDVPGLSLAVISNDSVVFYHTYGYRQQGHKEVVDKETIFEACSMTKSFLVMVAYELEGKGLLDLDKPMYQYLENARLTHDPRYKLITPRMILSHSSGIENWQFMNNPDTLDIVSNPGERFVYSGEGYQYLAKVIEVILHKPYEQYMEEMVFEPLKLKRTFTSYKSNGDWPTNYAVGIDVFGKDVNKWKNLEPWPAAGINTTAADYATLITAIFGGKYVSSDRIREMLKPAVRLWQNNPAAYYGPGFEVIYSGNDTIIAQGGSNAGFKGWMFYSVARKCGFVYLSNSDGGRVMAEKLSELTVGFDLTPRFKDDYFQQYPANAVNLLKIYREKGLEEMFRSIESLKRESKMDANTLNELGDLFSDKDTAAARKILLEDVELYSSSADAYFLMGTLNMMEKDYTSAYRNLRKARELNSEEPELNYDIRKCEALTVLRK